ncbi:MAG: alkaline phosphatase family protein [Bacteroidota bacterium]|nr:alkaline phosphatase family protein [Bacteroidota bacterium]
MKRLGFMLVFIGIAGWLNAQIDSRIPSDKPKLIVGIVVEQMRHDYIYKFWDKLSEGGFKRLLNEGTYCKNANFNYQFTQTAVGHATIATGTSPSYHGIVAEEWYTSLNDKVVNCVADENYKTVGGSYTAGRVSPKQLLTSTIGDEIRLANYNKSKVLSISLQSESAILSGGITANAAYWYDEENGKWVTSSYYMPELPGWIKDFNDKKLADVYLTRSWETKYPIQSYAGYCLPDDNKFETGIEGRKTFPYNLAEMNKNESKKKYNLLKSTPFGNTFTKDFAIASIVNEQLGKDDNTDLLMISFSSTESIGKNFGPESVEVMDAFLQLDKDIEHLLSFLDQEIGKQNLLVFLTSDHGVAQSPEYLADKGIPVGFFNQNGAISLLTSYLNAVYGKGNWIRNYYAQQLFLNRNLIEDSKLNLADFQQKAAQFLLQFSGVANTVTSTTLLNSYFPDGIFSKMQKNYNQKRSGDILINLLPGWVEKNGGTTGHNSPYSYDTHVPLIWYGWRVKRATILDPVDMTDIAPTISYYLNIANPNASVGKPIIGLLAQ